MKAGNERDVKFKENFLTSQIAFKCSFLDCFSFSVEMKNKHHCTSSHLHCDDFKHL